MVSGKTPFLVRGPFCKYSILFVLILGFDGALLHGNVVVSIEDFQLKAIIQFFNRDFRFSQLASKLKH